MNGNPLVSRVGRDFGRDPWVECLQWKLVFISHIHTNIEYIVKWSNKGRDMCNPVCGMVHIKEPLLLIERVAHVAAAGFLSHYLCYTLPNA